MAPANSCTVSAQVGDKKISITGYAGQTQSELLGILAHRFENLVEWKPPVDPFEARYQHRLERKRRGEGEIRMGILFEEGGWDAEG